MNEAPIITIAEIFILIMIGLFFFTTFSHVAKQTLLGKIILHIRKKKAKVKAKSNRK